MDTLFLKVLNMSISASWLIAAVLLLRLVLKKALKWLTCALWALVAVRLLCPLSFESSFSLVPNAEPIPQEYFMMEEPQNYESPVFDPVVNPNLPELPSVTANTSIEMMQWDLAFAAFVWLFGMAAMGLYAAVSCLRLRQKVRASLHLRDKIWICDDIQTPFILGVFRPKIYLPSAMDKTQLPAVIAHEKAHLARHDHWWKPLGFLVLTIHWFNPLVWAAYILLCRDIELACDEKVIRDMPRSESIAYSEALLACSTGRKAAAVCPLAFGEVGVKERVKRVLGYKKPAAWLVAAAAVLCAAAAVCFLTNPREPSLYEAFENKDYTILDQKTADLTLSVAKSKLTDAAYTSKGQSFDKNEVIVCRVDDTAIWLEKVMLSNEDDNLLYFLFDFSYDFSDYGSLLSPVWFLDVQNSRTQTELFLSSEELRDENTVYPGAVSMRSSGPGTKFAFYVSKDVCRQAQDVLRMEMSCNRIFYAKAGHETQATQAMKASVFRAKVVEIWDGSFLVEPEEDSWERSSADKIVVPIKNMPSSPEPQVGDILEIEHSGELLEIYPAQLTDVYEIRVVQQANEAENSLLAAFWQSETGKQAVRVTDYFLAEDGAYGLDGVVQYEDESAAGWKLAFIRDGVVHPVSQDWDAGYTVSGRLTYLGGGKVKATIVNYAENLCYECTMSYAYDDADVPKTDFVSESKPVPMPTETVQ